MKSQSSWSKGISRQNQKNRAHAVTACISLWHRGGNNMVAACTYCMNRPVTSWADDMVAACTYCMGTKVSSLSRTREYKRGKYHCTIDLLFDWFGISCMTTDNFCCYLQNRLIQTSQTGGQRYSDTSLPARTYLYSSFFVKNIKKFKFWINFGCKTQLF